MKTVTIDFTKTPVEISDRILGNQGEHNATKLTVIPPEAITANDEVISCSVVFQIGAHLKYTSEIVDKNPEISVKIPREVSAVNVVSLHLEGYDGKEELLVKSERINNLIFKESNMGDEFEGNVTPALAEQIAFIKKAMEEGFSSSKTFKTIRLTEYPLLPIELNSSMGIELILNSDKIKVGTEIKTVRFLVDGKMIDIRNLMEVDGILYILNMGTVYISSSGSPAIGTLSKLPSTDGAYIESFIFAKLSNYEITEVEIDYYE